jgi:hypothetical protein
MAFRQHKEIGENGTQHVGRRGKRPPAALKKPLLLLTLLEKVIQRDTMKKHRAVETCIGEGL